MELWETFIVFLHTFLHFPYFNNTLILKPEVGVGVLLQILNVNPKGKQQKREGRKSLGLRKIPGIFSWHSHEGPLPKRTQTGKEQEWQQLEVTSPAVVRGSWRSRRIIPPPPFPLVECRGAECGTHPALGMTRLATGRVDTPRLCAVRGTSDWRRIKVLAGHGEGWSCPAVDHSSPVGGWRKEVKKPGKVWGRCSGRLEHE